MKARPLRCPSEPPDVEMRREVTRTLIAHAVELPRPEPHPDPDLIGRTDRDQTSTRRRGPHHRRPARRGSGGALGPGYGRRRQPGASSELTLAEPGVRAHRTQERASKSSWVSGGLERIHGGQPTSDGGTPTGSDAEVWTARRWCSAVWTIRSRFPAAEHEGRSHDGPHMGCCDDPAGSLWREVHGEAATRTRRAS